MDAIIGIGGLILICFVVWLFVKLVFHPLLFELDLRNEGKKGIVVMLLLIACVLEKIGKLLEGIFGDSDDDGGESHEVHGV